MNVKKKTILNKKITIVGILFMLPAFSVIIFTVVIPIIWNIVLSFNEWNGNGAMEFVGVSNYMNLFEDSKIINSIKNSLFIALFSTIEAMLLGTVCAIFIYRMGRKESAFYRFVFYIPSMIPMTVVGLLFTFILAPDIGLLNGFLGLIGLESLQHAWLADTSTVLASVAAVQGWRFSGVIMMLIYGGLLAIPESLFESAKLDGSNYGTEVKYIILPLLKPTIQLAFSMMLLWSFKTYDMVWSLTQGGPGEFSTTAPIKMITIAFSYSKFGYSAALSICFTVLVMAIIITVRKILKGEVYEY